MGITYLLILRELVDNALGEAIQADGEVYRDSWDELAIEQVLYLLRFSVEEIPNGDAEVETILCVQLFDLGEGISNSSLDSTNDHAVK